LLSVVHSAAGLFVFWWSAVYLIEAQSSFQAQSQSQSSGCVSVLASLVSRLFCLSVSDIWLWLCLYLIVDLYLWFNIVKTAFNKDFTSFSRCLACSFPHSLALFVSSFWLLSENSWKSVDWKEWENRVYGTGNFINLAPFFECVSIVVVVVTLVVVVACY